MCARLFAQWQVLTFFKLCAKHLQGRGLDTVVADDGQGGADGAQQLGLDESRILGRGLGRRRQVLDVGEVMCALDC